MRRSRARREAPVYRAREPRCPNRTAVWRPIPPVGLSDAMGRRRVVLQDIDIPTNLPRAELVQLRHPVHGGFGRGSSIRQIARRGSDRVSGCPIEAEYPTKAIRTQIALLGSPA